MARYIYAIFEDMIPCFASLPADQRDCLFQLFADGLAAAKQEISYAKHSLEAAAKT